METNAEGGGGDGNEIRLDKRSILMPLESFVQHVPLPMNVYKQPCSKFPMYVALIETNNL